MSTPKDPEITALWRCAKVLRVAASVLVAGALVAGLSSGCASNQTPPPPGSHDECMTRCRGAAQAELECFCQDQQAERIEECETDAVSAPGCLDRLAKAWKDCDRVCARCPKGRAQ